MAAALSPSPTPQFLNREVDITPKLSFSTVQFDSDAVNTIVNAVLAALIVANLGSVVHKAINVTKRDFFCYRDYLRATIFNASDDVTRLLAWLRGADAYTSARWRVHPARVAPARLLVPCAARLLVLLVTFASVALTIPEERRFARCDSGDYVPELKDTLSQDEVLALPSLCTDVPLTTRRGAVNTRLSYCTQDLPAAEAQAPISGLIGVASAQGLIEVRYNPADTAVLNVTFQTADAGATRILYTEWSINDPADSPEDRRDKYRSLFLAFRMDVVFNLAIRAILVHESGCQLVGAQQSSPAAAPTRSRRGVSCTFNPARASKDLDAFVRAGLEWRRRRPGDPVSGFDATGAGAGAGTSPVVRRRVPPDGSQSFYRDCPIRVTVARPYLNMLPMALLLLLAFQLNLAVSLTVSQHGNVDDAAFHLMKEAVAVDVCSNPLQVTEDDRNLDFELPFRTVHCANGENAHAGFLITSDDRDVRLEVEPRRCVSRCMHAENRLVVAKVAALSSADSSSMTLDTNSIRARAPIY